jgi:hypothetical protein
MATSAHTDCRWRDVADAVGSYDPEAVLARAVTEGATVINPVSDEPGWRLGGSITRTGTAVRSAIR